ncbi:FMN reductase [Lampropedia cohaerens]|uniref:FMN reductase n=1 Tax=Lampropedia cohaerens TaxID=1610491 RepID=A0A0U1Q1Q6_9BURK|nr:flavin reductase [Lampropedia cohaerens]KKW68671.1 FMN reductase [Lampropedia cohaerens]
MHSRDLPFSCIDPAAFRDAMACLGAAVHIVTTDGPTGRAGFTASAVCSVTDSPATLLVCLQHSSSAYACVKANGVVCVNTLDGAQEDVSRRFGGKTPMLERFAGGPWQTLQTGAPVHPLALVACDCVITRTVTVATHDVLFCRVVAIQRAASAPATGANSCLVYAGRRYHRVPL